MFVISIWSLIFMIFFSLSFLSFLMSAFLLVKSYAFYLSWTVFSWGSTNIDAILLIDWVSMIFMSFVLFISGSVFFYSGEYMEGEKNVSRFIFLLAGFVGSMCLMILSPNLISILLGWDGLGLVSYCLVIYYQNFKSLNAGTLTVLSNRIGDVLILVAIVWMMNFGDWTFVSWMGNDNSLIFTSSLIILASLTKSAQIPFSAWLPAAMAAPTPVSSLVHSSTLVTAGIYLIIRLGWVYDFYLSETLMVLSVLTMFMAGLGACLEYDLKKIIALSTLSQLGLMMYSLSLGMVKLALFHLLMHALFKALLFMSAGCVIHGFKGWQDIRMMGSMMISLPYMSSCFVVSNLALGGMPFLAGFYSKDLILEVSLMKEINLLSLVMLFVSTGLTVTYTFRLIYYMVGRDSVISGSNNFSDGWGVMVKSCVGLVMFSVFFGSMISWMYVDFTFIMVPYWMKNLTIFVCSLGALFGGLISVSSYSLSMTKFSRLLWMSGSMWFLPYMSSQPLVNLPLSSGYNIMQFSDLGWMELLGGQGTSSKIYKMSNFMMAMSSSNLKFFILLVWIMLLMFIFF
uniref:NADH-ubiquinone oxidoreductase chain 5 n=1 Tax=Pollicipes polymerus TaxID=36137 RepID=Q6SL11_POLPY|nr:NADH dehydrogenase subunit 5 [Pollicipes polymerus]AAS00862.1 NADH dehydrogenase subunit 5 [Pollicipes polymerus]